MRKADHALLAPRLQVDVAGALVEGIGPEPIHHLHHALVVGIQLLVGLAQLDQLLEAGRAGIAAGLLGRTHRLGQRKEFRRIAVDVQGARHHPAHRATRLPLDLVHPVGEKGLGRGDDHLAAGHLHRQHAVPLGIAGAHGVGHLADIDPEGIDAQIVQPGTRGQPLRQRLDVERLAVARSRHRDRGKPHQGMLGAFGLRAARDRAPRLIRGNQAVMAQPFDQEAPIQRSAVVAPGGRLGFGDYAHEGRVWSGYRP